MTTDELSDNEIHRGELSMRASLDEPIFASLKERIPEINVKLTPIGYMDEVDRFVEERMEEWAIDEGIRRSNGNGLTLPEVPDPEPEPEEVPEPPDAEEPAPEPEPEDRAEDAEPDTEITEPVSLSPKPTPPPRKRTNPHRNHPRKSRAKRAG